jgi:hypothetical protein
MSDTTSFIFGKLGQLAQAGISTVAQAAAVRGTTPARKKKGCTPCAAKAAVMAAKARVAQGKL